MATIQFKKGDEYLTKISRLDRRLKENVLGKAIYGAADIVANSVRTSLQSVPTDERWGTQNSPTTGPKKMQKKGLYDSLGIAPMQDDGTGYVNVKIGFDGYNEVSTKQWPQGQPNQMVARSIERGTSYMQANPFMKKAVSKAKKAAVDHMKKTVDTEIEKTMKG